MKKYFSILLIMFYLSGLKAQSSSDISISLEEKIVTLSVSGIIPSDLTANIEVDGRLTFSHRFIGSSCDFALVPGGVEYIVNWSAGTPLSTSFGYPTVIDIDQMLIDDIDLFEEKMLALCSSTKPTHVIINGQMFPVNCACAEIYTLGIIDAFNKYQLQQLGNYLVSKGCY